MMITRDDIANRISSYLHHKCSLEALVDWAERSLMDEELEASHFEAIRDALARLGVADVRAFGLTWDECQAILTSLGYSAQIEITAH